MIKPKATGSMLNFNGPAAGVTGRETMPFVETTQKDFDWHALAGLTKCLAMTYAKDGIRINGIAPGVIETPMVTPEFKASFSPTLMPAHRLGQPEEIADAVAFLLSARASFIHGHLLSVDGGWNAK
ncbi:hypothetical protein RQP46_007808 [Phenoliferia psychrophenolica]